MCDFQQIRLLKIQRLSRFIPACQVEVSRGNEDFNAPATLADTELLRRHAVAR